MKRTMLTTALILLATGCATQDTRTAWQVQPANVVRHGMAEAAAQYQLGRIFQSQGRLDAAEVAFGKALAADPRHADALAALGVLYAERGELSRSTETFKRVVALAPDKAYLHNNVGYALHLEGKHAEAVEALRTAVTLDPAYERAWVNLRKAAEGAGQTEVAELAARHQLAPAVAALAAAPPPAAEPAPPQPVAVSAERTAAPARTGVRPTGGPYRQPDTVGATAMAADQAPAPAATKAPAARRIIKGRLELANANGAPRFATRLGKQLRKEGVRVSRITNHRSFVVRHSVIEYRTKAADSAMALRDRLGMKVALKKVPEGRVQSEMRLVLGRDSLPYLASLPAPVEARAPVRLARNDTRRPRGGRPG